jgi:hypothetical protein
MRYKNGPFHFWESYQDIGGLYGALPILETRRGQFLIYSCLAADSCRA